MFESTHPGPTGRGGRRLHSDKPSAGDADDADYVRCAQCGFLCLTTRDARGDTLDSPGLAEVTTRVTVPTTQVAAGYVDVVEKNVVSGCPFCGSHNYEGRRKLRVRSAPSAQARR